MTTTDVLLCSKIRALDEVCVTEQQNELLKRKRGANDLSHIPSPHTVEYTPVAERWFRWHAFVHVCACWVVNSRFCSCWWILTKSHLNTGTLKAFERSEWINCHIFCVFYKVTDCWKLDKVSSANTGICGGMSVLSILNNRSKPSHSTCPLWISMDSK